MSESIEIIPSDDSRIEAFVRELFEETDLPDDFVASVVAATRRCMDEGFMEVGIDSDGDYCWKPTDKGMPVWDQMMSSTNPLAGMSSQDAMNLALSFSQRLATFGEKRERGEIDEDEWAEDVIALCSEYGLPKDHLLLMLYQEGQRRFEKGEITHQEFVELFIQSREER